MRSTDGSGVDEVPGTGVDEAPGPAVEEVAGSAVDDVGARGSAALPVGRARPGPWAAVAVPLLLVVVAGGLRLARLDEPARLHFDEVYYVADARDHLRQGVEEVRSAHPPVGTWLIAAGIGVAGDEPFGWRLAPALAGTLTVLVTYLLALRLLRRRAPAALAALLVAVDGLAFTMSRIGMLDVFVSLFVLTGAWLLLVDRDDPRRCWRLLAGASFGLALGTKWSAALALAVALLVVLARDRSLRRIVVPLVVVPAAVYALGYTGWLVSDERMEEAGERCAAGRCDASLVDRVVGLVDEQREMASFHRRLEPSHPDRSSAWRWPLLQRPVLMYLERCPRSDGEECRVAPGMRARIVGFGNPVLWWGFAATTPVLAWLALRRRDGSAAIALAFSVGQWAPWLLTRPGYLFYLLPAVPFGAIGLALVVDRRPRLRTPAAVAVAVLAATAFAYWYPLWSAVETSERFQDDRIWFDSWR